MSKSKTPSAAKSDEFKRHRANTGCNAVALLILVMASIARFDNISVSSGKRLSLAHGTRSVAVSRSRFLLEA